MSAHVCNLCYKYAFLFSPNPFCDLYLQLQDVIKLHECKWVSCNQVAAPVMITQIHEGVCLLYVTSLAC